VDPLKDIVPVIALVDMILVLAVRSDLGVRTLDQFLAKARELGPRMRIGLAGIGAPHHLAALLIQRAAGLDMLMVPYKGGPPMIADAAGGHLDAVITTIPVGGPMVTAGKLNWIAIVQPGTIDSLPGVPSLAPILKGETIPTWNGIFAPSSTPVAVLNELHAALQLLLHTPAISAKLRTNGLEPLNLTRAETVSRLADEASYMKEFLSKVKLDFTT
jgi:tripartite-type tricarboxylate transporter receptor subunit TctC